MRNPARTDALIQTCDHALRTLFATPVERRSAPHSPVTVDEAGQPDMLNEAERLHAGALMRVNHVGEVCAQALYMGQAFATKNGALRETFIAAAAEEGDHLAWTAQRLKALNAPPSRLNPLWYAGAFGLGLLASRLGDRVSLGFVVETERQVEAHLASHLAAPDQGGLPAADSASRAVVAQMQLEEAAHGQDAEALGAAQLPEPVKNAMRGMARVMTRTAYYV
jgi:3-demethoxyubiquinol 3-hydroxylase